MSFVVGEIYKIKEEYGWIRPDLIGKTFIVLSATEHPTDHTSMMVTYCVNNKIYYNQGLCYIFYEHLK